MDKDTSCCRRKGGTKVELNGNVINTSQEGIDDCFTESQSQSQ